MISLNENLINVVNIDYARLGAQVISGVGFLGAGTIIHSKGSIKGLTTAASLWAVASLGLAIGMGYYNISIFGAIAIIVSLGALKRLEHRFMRNSGLSKIEIGYIDKKESIDFIKSIFNRWNIEIKDIEVYIKDDDRKYGVKTNLYTIKIYKGFSIDEMMHDLIKEECIIGVKKIS